MGAKRFWVTWDQVNLPGLPTEGLPSQGIEGPVETIAAANAIIRSIRKEQRGMARNITVVDEDPT